MDDSAAATLEAPASSAETPSTSDPSPSASNAADTANTAPAGESAAAKADASRSLHREAFDALAKGREPKSVNRELFADKAKDDAERPATGKSQREPHPGEADKADAPAASGLAGKFGFPDGTSDRDVQVLKRAQMDGDTWTAIPPSNRVKILNNLRAQQANADREFQQKKGQGKPGQGRGEPGTASPGPEGDQEGTQTDQSDLADEPTQAGGDARQQQEQTRNAAASRAPAVDPAAIASFVDPQELETLRALGGDDLAQTFTAGIGRVVNHFQQQTGQLLNVAEFLLSQHVDSQFDRGLSELENSPGLEKLRDDSMSKEREALRAKADLLHRAAGDPKGYTYQEAMKDAAASLFKTNIHQAAQSRLLKGRGDSLRGSADRGTGRRAEPRQLDAKERNRAIFAELARGAAPDAARMAVDGR